MLNLKNFIICIVGLFTFLLSAQCYSAEKWSKCNVVDVTVFDKSRLHIRCSPAVDGYTFFAVPWSNTEFLNQSLSVATAAIAYKKTINVRYNPSDKSTGPTFDCAAGDCRPLMGITLNR